MMAENKFSRYPWKYFVLVFSVSWIFWGVIILIGLEINQMPAPILFAIAGAAPMIIALLLTYASEQKEQRPDFWVRVLDMKRLGVLWLLICLLTAPILIGLAGWIDRLYHGTGIMVEENFIRTPLSLIPTAIFLFFFGPLPEELGWRGYALDGLQERFSPFVSSLILGFLWALWHLPLFFINGSYQQLLRSQTQLVILFPINIFSQTFLMTWIYNRTQRSTLSAVLFHFAVNLSGEMFLVSLRAEVLIAFLWVILALLVLFFGRYHRISPS